MPDSQPSKTDGDAWTPQEKAAFHAWAVAPAPRDYADDVVAAVRGAPSSPSRSRWPWALAASIALMWAVQASAWTLPDAGEFRGRASRTLPIGRRVIAVTSGQTSMTWRVGWSGAASVRQRAGRVFYRVEPGSTFDVATDVGTVRVRGTCFSVEVETEAMTPTNVASAVGGAAVAAAVTIAVYEGRVDVDRGEQTVSVAAGERLALPTPDGPGRAPRLGTPSSTSAHATRAGRQRDDATVRGPATQRPLAEHSSPVVRRLVAEKAALDAQVHALEAEVQALKERPRGPTSLEPDAATLKRMAEACEIAWDMPTVRVGRSPTLSDDDAAKLELTEPEVETVNRIFDEYNQSMIEQIRALYTQITGDDQVGSLSIDSMFAEVRDKVSDVEKRVLFQRLSAERAGLQTPPVEAETMTPLERLYRLYVGAGHRVEASLAAELGAETARNIRALRDGFSTKNNSSFGCP